MLEFLNLAEEIIEHPEFLKSKEIKHHSNSIFDHSYDVAFISYKIAKKLNLDYKSIVRGALLHDFFLYDWRVSGNRHIKHLKNMHGIIHPKIALENSKKHFELNEKEEEIILKHMFPLSKIPKHKESWIIIFVDKYCAIKEYFVQI